MKTFIITINKQFFATCLATDVIEAIRKTKACFSEYPILSGFCSDKNLWEAFESVEYLSHHPHGVMGVYMADS